LVKKQAQANGRRTRHKLDVGVVNGSLYAGAFALSFATGQPDRQWKDTDAVAFALEDLREAEAEVPLCVVTDTPAGFDAEAYDRAQRLFTGMHVDRVPVEDVNGWAARAITAVPDALIEHG
jgi:hypothetical protein